MWTNLTSTNATATSAKYRRCGKTVEIEIIGLTPNSIDPNLVLVSLPTDARPLGLMNGIYCTGFGVNSNKPHSFLIKNNGDLVHLCDTAVDFIEPLNLTVQYKLIY